MAKKQARKYSKAKKVLAKVQQGSQQPSQALLGDMQKLFDKHDWPGNLVGRALAVSGSSHCPPGTTPHEITYQLPDGTWVTKTVCLPNTSSAEASLPGEPGTQDDFVSASRGHKGQLAEADLAGETGKQDD